MHPKELSMTWLDMWGLIVRATRYVAKGDWCRLYIDKLPSESWICEGLYINSLGVSPSIEDCLQSLRLYDFLWQQDIHSSYQHFLASQPNIAHCSANVQNFMDMETKIEAIPSIFSVGPLQLSAKPVKNSLRALAVSWKMEFTNFIHQQAKVSFYVFKCATDMHCNLE